MSTPVAEYYALASAAKEGMALAYAAEDFCGTRPDVVILTDNESAKSMAELAKFSDKTKHVLLAEAFVHERIKKGDITLYHVDSGSNLADIFTKGLPRVAFSRIRDVLLGSTP